MKLATQAGIKFPFKQITIEQIVDNLNERLWRNTENEQNYFIYSKCGMTNSISIYIERVESEIYLWDDENDDRKFIEKKNDYENLEEFIIKKLKNYIKDLQKLSKALCK